MLRRNKCWNSIRRLSVEAAASWRGRKKFFTETGVYHNTVDGRCMFGVTLNGKKLSSPNRLPLLVPSEILAQSLAYEWEMQEKVIRPTTMPLVVLGCSAVDVTPFNREKIIEEIMRYFETDTLCYFQESSEKLYQRQLDLWNPIIDSFQNRFGHVATSGYMAKPKHSKQTIDKLKLSLLSLDDYSLTAMESLTSGLKSIVAAAHVLGEVEAYSSADVAKQVIDATRVEEEIQIEEWGLVEGGHDIDRANILTQVYAATYFLRCLR